MPCTGIASLLLQKIVLTRSRKATKNERRASAETSACSSRSSNAKDLRTCRRLPSNSNRQSDGSFPAQLDLAYLEKRSLVTSSSARPTNLEEGSRNLLLKMLFSLLPCGGEQTQRLCYTEFLKLTERTAPSSACNNVG